MRPACRLFIILMILLVINGGLYAYGNYKKARKASRAHVLNITTAGLGLTDLCVATEARYTRHPAVSDPMVPFMDHPGAIEHFPTGSFWAPQQ